MSLHHYPHTTGHISGSETSQESAQEIDNSGAGESQAREILRFLDEAGPKGATADELTQHMQQGDFPKIHNGTVAGRLVHLERQGAILKTALTRKTRSNRNACVYILVGMRGFFTHAQLDVTGRQNTLGPQMEKHKAAIIAALDCLKVTGYGREHAPMVKILRDALGE